MEKMTRKDFLRASFGGMAALAAVGVAAPARHAHAASVSSSLFNVAMAASGGDGSETSPWTGWEAAVNDLDAACSIHFPKGIYAQAQTVKLKPGWRVYGDGKQQSIIHSSVGGDAFLSSFLLNGAKSGNLDISHLTLECIDPAANGGGGISDVYGSLIHLHDLRVTGFKYGIILDQSELVSVEHCELSAQTACIWLVSGNDYAGNEQVGFTNRITVAHCQLHNAASVGCMGIIDDGGYAHTFSNNLFNGCETHIHIAGTVGAVIAGSRFEGSSSTPIISTHVAFHHQDGSLSPGANVNLTIRDNVILPPKGKPSAYFFNGNPLTLLNNLAYGSPTFAGMANCHTVIALGNFNAYGAVFDATPKRLLALNSAPTDEMYLHTTNLKAAGLSIGGGANISKHLSGFRTWTPPSVGNGGATWVTLPLPGAVVGDTVAVGFSRPVPGGAVLSGAVTAPAVVTVTLFNLTGKVLNLGEGTLRADLWRH